MVDFSTHSHRNINLKVGTRRTMAGRAPQDGGSRGSLTSAVSLLLSDNGDVIPCRAAEVVSRVVFHDTISDTSQLGRPLRLANGDFHMRNDYEPKFLEMRNSDFFSFLFFLMDGTILFFFQIWFI